MKWLYNRKEPVFEQLGYSWEDFLDHFKVGMAKTFASFHVTLNNPDSVVRSYIKLIRYYISFLLESQMYVTGLYDGNKLE